MNPWLLVTGGVYSGIGKGCLAACAGRALALAGHTVDYRKVEPCLQGDIGLVENSHFGEIVRGRDGTTFDGDVARASFMIPGFSPDARSDLSLGRAAAEFLADGFARRSPAPRLGEMSEVYRRSIPRRADFTIVELGGTAGEPEHRLLCDLLLSALGSPAAHLHLTTLVQTHDGRTSSKAAQISLSGLPVRPDSVFVRGGFAGEAASPEALPRFLGVDVPVLAVDTDAEWPERAHDRAIRADVVRSVLRRRLGVDLQEDGRFGASSLEEALGPAVVVIHDGPGQAGYASLMNRLRAWTGARLRVRFQTDPVVPAGARGVIRIGERAPARAEAPTWMPILSIVPMESARDPRDPDARPDWQGTMDSPEGPLAAFTAELMTRGPSISGAAAGLAYADAAFASIYLAESGAGRLRDHAQLDRLIWSALPGPERLRGARILDVGCGDGRWAARLLEAGVAEVVGIEPAPPMADAAAARHLLGLRLVRCRVEDAELDGQFDAILGCMSIDHVERLAPFVARCAKHLRPFGRLIVTTEHPLRTATVTGPRWIADGPDSWSARVRDYGLPGWRFYRWFGHPAEVAVYHRPIESWVEAIRHSGLHLVALREPIASDERDARNPRFWLLVAERQGKPRPLATIDGPAGSGKSSLGDALARHLGWLHVDTGRMMRAFALRRRDGLAGRQVQCVCRDGAARWLIGDRDVSQALADPTLAPLCAAVRDDEGAVAEMDTLLRELTADPSIVSGRSFGRTIRDAVARFWLDAPIDVRAARRGCSVAALEARDAQDADCLRLVDPDIDACVLDSSSLPVTDLAAAAAECIAARLPQR